MNNLLSKPLLLAAFVAAALACMPAFAAMKSKVAKDDGMSGLIDMSDQLDGIDKQDFQAAIERANDCTRARNFSCSESELAKAAKSANSGQDKKTLATARQNITNEKVQIAAEERQRAEEARRVAKEEERQRKEEEAREERRQERERQAQRDREERESASTGGYDPIMASIQANIADGMGRIAEMDRGLALAMADSRRVQAEQAAQRARARAEQEERAAEQRRDAERAQEARIARADTERQRTQQVEQDRAREQERRQKQAQEAADRQAAEQARAREQEQERQRQAKEKADRLAQEQADKAAEQQAKRDYLTAMRSGIRLSATTCLGGEGNYYATGSMPKIKKSLSCIDVSYRAYCPGSAAYSSGVARNFIGMSGCFGDTYQISPKPGCPVEQVRIEVTDVQPGCN